MADTTAKEIGEIRQSYVDQFQKAGSENLAQVIKGAKASEIDRHSWIEALRDVYPEHKEELESLWTEVHKIREKQDPFPNPDRYVDADDKIQLNWLAEELEEEFEFRYLSDSDTIYVYKDGFFQTKGEEVIQSEVNRRLGDEFSKRRKSEVIETIKTRKYAYTERSEFQCPPRKLNLANGVYDLEEEELLDHDPEYNFTYKIDIDYNPDSECPNIHSFLHDIVETERDVKTLQEIAGYTLLPSYPINKAFVLVGQGNNGKSRFLELLMDGLLGAKNYETASMHTLEENRFATSDLYSKLAVYDDDLDGGKLSSTNTLKKLTGGAKVDAEVKYGGRFKFSNYATPIFACNEIPETSDNSDGFFRRWVILDFPYKFVESPEGEYEKQGKDKTQLMNELKQEEELEGFLWWAIESLKDVLENGGFTYAPTPAEARQKWREYSTPVVSFTEKFVKQGTSITEAQRESGDQAEITEYDYDYVRKDDLRRLMKVYCKQRSKQAPTKTRVTRVLNNSELQFGNSRTRQDGGGSQQVQIYSGLRVEFDVSEVDGTKEYWENLLTEGSRQSVSIYDGDEEVTPGKLGGKVKDFVEENFRDEEFEAGELWEKMNEELNLGSVDEEKFDEIIKRMKGDGELFEPRQGKLKLI